ncbi:alkene reductase [Corynebacterium sp.]|uniref:alkene reductase n=1 Tax=Corynebacterium sp. TaxID=1720 RepID=UPI0026E07A68|nr:alkene reductase [Corynebacterium sp.]MDO5511744.1 alkene reductase [Corynebacterium sp.]
MTTCRLLRPCTLSGLRLRNRVVMAPLTRSRAQPDGTATDLMEVYYTQRATAGLIVSEGIVVSPQGVAYPRVPGLYTDAQAHSWGPITRAVHERGGHIVAQLWHVGRQSHSSVQPDGGLPVAPSAIPITGFRYYRRPEQVPFETPRALSREEIRDVIGQYAAAARRAVDAGFDGVELHAANGYLIDQFLNSGSNNRSDEYGGSPANRARFLHEIITAVAQEIPVGRIGVRLSPSSRWMDALDEDKRALHRHVVSSLAGRGLAYLHLVEPEIAGSSTAEVAEDAVPTAELRPLIDAPVIITGGHTFETAERLLEFGDADFVGFGRPYIANPDLPERLAAGAPLHRHDRRTFYSGGAEGYLTYPSLEDERRWDELCEAIRAGERDPTALAAELSGRTEVELARDGLLHAHRQLLTILTPESESLP